MNPTNEELFWFSQFTIEYEVQSDGKSKKFGLKTKEPLIKLDWDNCTVEIAERLANGNVRFMIRSKTNRNSDYMGGIPVQLRFMIMIDVEPSTISEPHTEVNYQLSASERKNLPKSAREIIHDRWVFKLGDKGEIWEWTHAGIEIRSSRLFRLHQEIRKFLDASGQMSITMIEKNIIRVPVNKLDEVIPVVYQPAVDSLSNFLRELHCAKKINYDGSIDVEVTMLFNNEQLRKFKLADGFYRWLRKLLYGRLIDIETFRIHFVKDKLDANYFAFEGIYDTIHLDKPPNVPHRSIEYYFSDQFHAMIFVNTSNHALAGHDNNWNLWKWEYVSWIRGAPIVYGTSSRKELEKSYKSLFSIFG
jgi:hypothetical protein